MALPQTVGEGVLYPPGPPCVFQVERFDVVNRDVYAHVSLHILHELSVQDKSGVDDLSRLINKPGVILDDYAIGEEAFEIP